MHDSEAAAGDTDCLISSKASFVTKKTRTHKSSLLDLHTCIVTIRKYPKFKIILVSNYIWFWCWGLRNQILNLYVLQRKIPNSKMIRFELHMVLMLQNKKSKNHEHWAMRSILCFDSMENKDVSINEETEARQNTLQSRLSVKTRAFVHLRVPWRLSLGKWWDLQGTQPGTVWESTCCCLLHSVAAKVLIGWSTTEAGYKVEAILLLNWQLNVYSINLKNPIPLLHKI